MVQKFVTGSKPHLLSIPPEIRARIYEYLFPPTEQIFDSNTPAPPCTCRVCTQANINILSRTFDDPEANRLWILKRTSSCVNLRHPSVSVYSQKPVQLSFLRVCRLIYVEALRMVYANTIFDFCRALGDVIPFFDILNLRARSAVRDIRLAAPTYAPCGVLPELHVWDAACRYIPLHLTSLKNLHLSFFYPAGRIWTPEKWDQKLHIDPATQQFTDPVVRNALKQIDGSATRTYLQYIDPETGRPGCRDFLERLPIEDVEESLTNILGKDGVGCDPLIEPVTFIRQLKHLEITLTGGLQDHARKGIAAFLKRRMLAGN